MDMNKQCGSWLFRRIKTCCDGQGSELVMHGEFFKKVLKGRHHRVRNCENIDGIEAFQLIEMDGFIFAGRVIEVKKFLCITFSEKRRRNKRKPVSTDLYRNIFEINFFQNRTLQRETGNFLRQLISH